MSDIDELFRKHAEDRWNSRISRELFSDRQYPGINLYGQVAGIHPCELAPGEIDHDYEYKADDQGDGIWSQTTWYVECKNCGHCSGTEDGPGGYYD